MNKLDETILDALLRIATVEGMPIRVGRLPLLHKGLTAEQQAFYDSLFVDEGKAEC